LILLAGQVIEDVAGAPLRAVSVQVDGTTLGTITDSLGQYVLQLPDDLRGQTIRVTARRVGYAPASRDVAVAGDVVRADFSMSSVPLRLRTTVATGADPTTAAVDQRDARNVEFSRGAAAAALYEQRNQRAGEQPLFEYQVDRPAMVSAGTPGPRYPADLRAEKVEGRVVATFVVDTLGRAEVETFKVVSSNRPQFADAVRTALPGMRFTPAAVGERKVRSWVQQVFEFRLSP
jgi:TonB family protein